MAKLFVIKEGKQFASRTVVFSVLVNVFAVLQTWTINMGLVYCILPSSGAIVFTSYIGHKRWSFR
jgi:hypothetical protein